MVFDSYKIDLDLIDRLKGSFNILYLGDTSIRRGTMTAIESMPEILKEIPGAKLILVGKSSADAQLKRRVEELRLEKEVVFEGWQDLSLFPSYIKASEICISPLLRNLHHDTTYANKIFQYMGIGKPLIVSDCPAQAHVIADTKSGLIFKAGDISDFEEKVLKL